MEFIPLCLLTFHFLSLSLPCPLCVYTCVSFVDSPCEFKHVFFTLVIVCPSVACVSGHVLFRVSVCLLLVIFAHVFAILCVVPEFHPGLYVIQFLYFSLDFGLHSVVASLFFAWILIPGLQLFFVFNLPDCYV